MSTASLRVRIAAVVCTIACLLNVGIARAQQSSPPDIRGSYPVDGIETIYGCTFDGGPTTAIAFPALVTISTQEGNDFSGVISDSLGQTAVFTLTGHVSDEGLVEGTWIYVFLGEQPFENQAFTGEIANGKAALELTATFGVPEFFCRYRVSLSASAVTLSWSPPDPTSADPLAPPRALLATPTGSAAPGKIEDPASSKVRVDPTGYNVYRSTTPGVQATPDNLFTSVPATQTSVPAADGSSGSFFVVTATYPSGESDPSNEVSGGVPAGTIAKISPKATKLVVKGKDFSSTVQVFLDGIPFLTTPMVKKGAKVVQTGTLVTGQTVTQYITPGKTVTVSVRNSNGGVATKTYSKP